MSLETFAKLKEYDSLLRMRNQHLTNVKEQEGRLVKLAAQRDSRQQELDELVAAHLKTQQAMGDLEARLRQASEQRERLKDYGGDGKKIAELAGVISSLEEQGFLLLGELEDNEKARAEAKTFLEGLGRTMNEIGEEAKEIQVREKESMRSLDERLSLLMAELPAEFKDLLQRVLTKNLTHGPFTRTQDGSCFLCRNKISRVDESEIDMQKKLRTCSQCGRIFVPYGT